MTEIDKPNGYVPLEDDGSVSLATLVALIADDVILPPTYTELQERYHPTEGRPAITTSDNTVYLGTGTGWVDATDELRFSAPGIASREQSVGALTTESYADPNQTYADPHAVVDTEQVEGRVIGAESYIDPPGYSASATPDAYDPDADATVSDISLGGHLGWVAGDALFVVKEAPLRVYRAPDYSDAFANDTELQFSQTLTGQAGSWILDRGHREHQVAVDIDAETGTIVVGEADPDSSDPELYRSTDNGQSWSAAYTETRSGHTAFHAVFKDPYSDTWIAATGDANTDRFVESTDDGATWSSTSTYGFVPESQAAAVDADEEYLYFANDQGPGRYHGPWVYRRTDGATMLLCGQNPNQAFRDLPVANLRDAAVAVDRATGVVYVLGAGGGGWVAWKVPGIGRSPEFVTTTGSWLAITDEYLSVGDELWRLDERVSP